MDSKQLIASIISSIASMIGSFAWPMAIAFSLALFRVPIADLIGRIKEFNAAGLKMSFSELVADIAEEGQRLKVATNQPPSETIAPDEAVIQLAELYPEAAVRQEYNELVSVIFQIGSRLPDCKFSKNPYDVLTYLFNAKRINRSVISLFSKIRKARLGALQAQGETMTTEQAMVLIRETRMLKELLRSIGKEFPSPPEVSEEKPRP